ncbi:hypothetical protein [Singulisphaera sp. PoT]|uniref:hypothetical protein n=1 Tax=Singulisphaera sp. PoT TaxID=3411797 RepID=UPI003BF5187E
MPIDNERPVGLHLADKGQKRAAMMAYVAARGPSGMSDLELGLGSLSNKELLHLTLTELLAAGRFPCEMRTFIMVNQKAKARVTATRST